MLAGLEAVVAVYNVFLTAAPAPSQTVVQVFDDCEVAKVLLSKAAAAHRFLARGHHLLTIEDNTSFVAMLCEARRRTT